MRDGKMKKQNGGEKEKEADAGCEDGPVYEGGAVAGGKNEVRKWRRRKSRCWIKG
jgi:hypothetical protein